MTTTRNARRIALALELDANADAKKALDALATALVHDDDIDLSDTLIVLASHLDTPMRDLLAARLDLCPIHFCDAQICADDEVMICRDMRDAL